MLSYPLFFSLKDSSMSYTRRRSYGCARYPTICRHFQYPSVFKKIHGCPLPGLYFSYSLFSPRWLHSTPFFFFFFLFSCLRPYYLCTSSLSYVRRWSDGSTNPYKPRESYQTCVYPEVRSLPDDVARRTLYCFFVDSFDVSRTTNSLFNDTPARACKQLAEPERRTFSSSYFFHITSSFFFSLFIHPLRISFLFCTSHII